MISMNSDIRDYEHKNKQMQRSTHKMQHVRRVGRSSEMVQTTTSPRNENFYYSRSENNKRYSMAEALKYVFALNKTAETPNRQRYLLLRVV